MHLLGGQLRTRQETRQEKCGTNLVVVTLLGGVGLLTPLSYQHGAICALTTGEINVDSYTVTQRGSRY